MAKYTVNERGVEQARRVIENRHYELRNSGLPMR
jgi:hypothetical protein